MQWCLKKQAPKSHNFDALVRYITRIHKLPDGTVGRAPDF